MSDMIAFVQWLLPAISDFLMSEPIIYVVGVCISCGVVKMVRSLINI